MEFLAESIGLLDIDGGAYATPNPHQQQHDETTESNNTTNGIVDSTLRSLFLFSWGESSESNINREEDGGSAEINEQNVVSESVKSAKKAEYLEDDSNNTLDTKYYSEGMKETDLEQEDELGTSSLSLLSSLTPASPMTLSASSLDLLSSPPNEATGDERQSSDGCSNDCNVDSNTACRCQCNCQECQNHDPSWQSDCDDDDKLHSEPPTTAPATFMPAIDNILTKHVTQRIDARTNYDCFTGNVDAVTGHLIHGTMLYRQTGMVYEGPFITKYVTTETATNSNTNVSQGKYNDKAEFATTSCDTVPLRHGKNATCIWSNGMKFVGSFEYDHPKSGTWVGGSGEWTYEGPLLVVVQEENERTGNESMQKKGGNNNTKYDTLTAKLDGMPSPPSSSGSVMSNSVANHFKKHSLIAIIGIPRPLPGSVLFHGKGRFARSDGLVYEGEFHHGLANGVGKEIFVSNGQEGTYYGEFSGGLRHGVGTLMEDCKEEKCDCQCENEGDDCGDESGQMLLENHEFVSRLDVNENCNNSSTDDVSNNNQSIDPGPDFAAGGTKSSNDTFTSNSAAGVNDTVTSSLPATSNHTNNDDSNDHDTANNIANPLIHVSDTNNTDDSYTSPVLFQSPKPKTPQTSKQCKICHCHYQSNKAKKQRYSSGVWCAGQYEIEDCRGTVHPYSNEFTEEGCIVTAAAAAATIASTTVSDGNTANNGESTSMMAVSSLNRTTWDMLDEKWLGI